MRKLCFVIACAVVLAAPFLLYGVGRATDTPFPKKAKLAVSLQVEEDGSGTLKIRNRSKEGLTLQKPSNRLALTFLVTDQHGNVVRPTGRAKVNRLAGTLALGPGETHVHSFKKLDFLTGTALFGYDLEKGKRYRVVAVYRPAGLNGPGFSSDECVLEVK